jgi:hypothetical protein
MSLPLLHKTFCLQVFQIIDPSDLANLGDNPYATIQANLLAAAQAFSASPASVLGAALLDK